jgi:hypothetical protein
MKPRLAIVIAVASISLALAAQAFAIGEPAQVSPEDGATITSGDPIVFRASPTDVVAPTHIDFYVASDNQVDPGNGVLAPPWVDHLRSDPPLFQASPRSDAIWPTRPGTYYWQAVYSNCAENPGGDCFSGIRSLTVVQRPASTVGPGSEPNTFLNRHPRHRTHKHRARFAFSSDVGGAHFQCLFAQGWSKCRSPHIFRHLKPGRYKFAARAVVNGVQDPTAASWVFKVIR